MKCSVLGSCRRFYVGSGGNVDDFYSDSTAQKNYQAHLAAVTSHVNSLTNVVRARLPAGAQHTCANHVFDERFEG